MRRGAAHTQTGLFRTADLGRVLIDFASPMGKILPLTPTESGTNKTTKLRRGGEMANAADLKSAIAKATYGFESHPRH